MNGNQPLLRETLDEKDLILIEMKLNPQNEVDRTVHRRNESLMNVNTLQTRRSQNKSQISQYENDCEHTITNKFAPKLQHFNF